ncbi:Uncharacterised protein [Vibrio cholerae]|uniref:Uncharacterized protein n=1 Tax=Vibrio cholerae TaxID=666 RepID=A0A655ZRL9_VIBCL|nr:Uncharacterised protein [Vibrio cholerae]
MRGKTVRPVSQFAYYDGHCFELHAVQISLATPQTNGRHYTPKGCERKRLHHRVRDIKSVAFY